MKEEYRTAIWLALAAAVLMLGLTMGHCQAPHSRVKRTRKHLIAVEHRLDKLGAWGIPSDSTDLFVMRGELDWDLAWNALLRYHAEPSRENLVVMDRKVRQLDRDMEDFPPQMAEK